MHTADGRGLGKAPPPFAFPGRAAPTFLPAEIFPATYDLRTLGKVSPVERQAPCGTCWTFGALGALESYLLPNSTTQFSENNSKNYHLFDATDCCRTDGGDRTVATAYPARWGTTETLDDGTPSTLGRQRFPVTRTILARAAFRPRAR